MQYEDGGAEDTRAVVLTVEGNGPQQLSIRPVNLQPLRADGAGGAISRLVHAWIDSGPATSVFTIPAWEALDPSRDRVRDDDDDERAREKRDNARLRSGIQRELERAQVHNLCQNACEERGLEVKNHSSADEGTTRRGKGNRPWSKRGERPCDKDRIAWLELKSTPSALVAADAPSDSMRQMPFVELCRVLEALDSDVDQSRKGFNERRLRVLAAFWQRGEPCPRHLRSHLFDVFRLLLPHNDTRRYYLGEAGIVKAIGLTMLNDARRAKDLSLHWMDPLAWARGVDFPRGRDAALVLQHEWSRRARHAGGIITC
eukprot:6604883-Prymnesium_polylepis.1